MPSRHALIIFVDIRGFTQWAEGHEVSPHMEALLEQFSHFLKKQFTESAYIKGLGDGAMIVHEHEALLQREEIDAALKQLLADTLENIAATEKTFRALYQRFAIQYGYRTALALGWGITRGTVTRAENPASPEPPKDYLGPNVNKAARLCTSARPCGIVIERDDFHDIPAGSSYQFMPREQLLAGIRDPIAVWVTPEIATGFVPREERRETPEVHVAGVCMRADPDALRILLAKRNPTRRLYPSRYEGCGGQLALGESFADGVQRHFLGEMDIHVEVDTASHLLYEIIAPDAPYIPGLRFLCRYKDGEPMKDGKPKSPRHSDVRWMTEEEIDSLPEDACVPGLQKDIQTLLSRYRTQSGETIR